MTVSTLERESEVDSGYRPEDRRKGSNDWRAALVALPVSVVVSVAATLATVEARVEAVDRRLIQIEQTEPAVQRALSREFGGRFDRMETRMARIEGLLLAERARSREER